MHFTRINNNTFMDLRSNVRRELLRSYSQFYFRAYQAVPTIACGTFVADVIIKSVLDFLPDALLKGNYRDFSAWTRTMLRYSAQADGIRGVLSILKRDVLAICSSIIPKPCPLMGEIKLRYAHLENIACGIHLDEIHTDEAPPSGEANHDPIDSAVDEIIKALSEKDDLTGEHSRAVSQWCHQIALRLGLPEEDVTKVTRGGLIHDIGKVTIPLDILAAPRRLSVDERLIMESHVTAGHSMLKEIPVLADFQSMVRHHHERCDGGGYPDGLSGGDIPFLTRIVTVADCFNAMIGRRSYRAAMSPLAAMQEIRLHRSRQFDPDVTDAMTEIVLIMTREEEGLGSEWQWSEGMLCAA